MPSLKAMAQEAKKKADQSKKTAATTKNSKKSSATSLFSRSTEKVADSDLESETESEEDSESEPESAPKPIVSVISKSKVQKPKAAPPSSSSESKSEGDSSESSSESEESDDEDEEIPKTSVTNLPATRRTSSTPVPPPAKRAKTSAYTPPKGFEILATSTGRKPKASDFFSSSNLANKQLWYITAPASIPIASIKKVSMKDIQSGKSAITVDGQNYGFVREKAEEQGVSQIMLPDEEGKQYSLSKRAIDNTLHLQQVVKLSGSKSGSDSKATVPQAKPVRQQPQGLKMRFKPIGFGSGRAGIIGESSSSATSSDDEEMDDARLKFRALPKQAESLSSDDSASDQEMVDAQETIEPDVKVASKPSETEETSSSSDDDETSSESTSESEATTPLPSRSKSSKAAVSNGVALNGKQKMSKKK